MYAADTISSQFSYSLYNDRGVTAVHFYPPGLSRLKITVIRVRLLCLESEVKVAMGNRFAPSVQSPVKTNYPAVCEQRRVL
ncbi:hypothetical protein XELAEV_18013961mg [Xenopus laevis]|uniref:Uncharacterized protein n=1 Tax=Xenopus laevis TaxID=8355 RepID=A0A974DRQ0_XENLA|nr:hypothetical protein XELAEV_18013961mg [Xenopus laevis]